VWLPVSIRALTYGAQFASAIWPMQISYMSKNIQSRGPRRERPTRPNRGNAPPEELRLGWSFGYVFREANRAFSDTFRDELRPYGITLGQWFFLRELWDEEGLSQRELSKRVGVREPTTATALEIMARRKLIVRRKKQGDHRSQFVHLTAKGRSLRNELLVAAFDLNNRALHGFSKSEIKDLRGKILKMIKNLGSGK
jgi:MarR family transcriptional regulator, organic hydroperoxide resistance regulator